MSKPRGHDFGFFVWAADGFLIVFGSVAGFSIGLPFLALGLVLFVYLLMRGPTWPYDLGLLAGIGSASLLFGGIAALSGDYSPTPWAQIGLALVGVSAGVFWWLRCRPVQPSPK